MYIPWGHQASTEKSDFGELTDLLCNEISHMLIL